MTTKFYQILRRLANNNKYRRFLLYLNQKRGKLHTEDTYSGYSTCHLQCHGSRVPLPRGVGGPRCLVSASGWISPSLCAQSSSHTHGPRTALFASLSPDTRQQERPLKDPQALIIHLKTPVMVES